MSVPSEHISRWCSACATVTLFEVPPCEDGHGLDCLDLACTDCGSAIVLGEQEAAVLEHAAAA